MPGLVQNPTAGTEKSDHLLRVSSPKRLSSPEPSSPPIPAQCFQRFLRKLRGVSPPETPDLAVPSRRVSGAAPGLPTAIRSTELGGSSAAGAVPTLPAPEQLQLQKREETRVRREGCGDGRGPRTGGVPAPSPCASLPQLPPQDEGQSRTET